MLKIKSYIPTTGNTVQLEDFDESMVVVIRPTTDLAALTIAMPLVPQDGQSLTLLFTRAITTLTMAGSLNLYPTTVRSAGSFKFIYDVNNAAWMNDGGESNGSVWSFKTYAATTGAVSGTSGTGNAVFYPTSNLTAGGTPVFAEITAVIPLFDVAQPNNAFSKPVVASDLKTITINCKTQTFNGVVVLSINVLGSVTVANAANGIALSVLVFGRLA